MKIISNKFRLYLFGSTIGLILFLGCGCASLVSKSNYPVTINSSPADADVQIKDNNGMVVFSGKTPTTALLRSGGPYFNKYNYTLTFNKPGYNQTAEFINSNIDPAYWGNILFGGLVGMLIVDPMTGAMWELPGHVTATLHPNPHFSPTSASTVETNSYHSLEGKLEKLKNLKENGTITETEYQAKKKQLIDEL